MFSMLLKGKLLKRKLKKLALLGMIVGEGSLLFPDIGSFGSEPYLIRIGKNCLIANGVKCITHDGAIRVINNKDGQRTIDNKYGKIDIGDNVYIGENAILMPNVAVGPNACVLPGSVVYRNVPPGAVAAGNPAKVVHTVDDFDAFYNKEVYPHYKEYYFRFYRQLMP